MNSSCFPPTFESLNSDTIGGKQLEFIFSCQSKDTVPLEIGSRTILEGILKFPPVKFEQFEVVLSYEHSLEDKKAGFSKYLLPSLLIPCFSTYIT